MNNKEVEEFLYKKAMEEVPERDFEDVWENIKGRMLRKPKRNWKLFWQKTLATAAIIAVLVCPYVAIPFMNSTEILYSDEELIRENVEKIDFDTAIDEVEFSVVDFSLYIGDGFILYKTDTGVVKGGSLNLTDTNYMWFSTLNFYEETIVLEDATIDYDQTCTVGTAVVEYRLKEYIAEYGMYTYDMKVNYKSVNYLMEYTCMTDDLTPFLQSFFS